MLTSLVSNRFVLMSLLAWAGTSASALAQPATAPAASTPVSAAALQAARVGDDQQFAVRLAEDRTHMVLFLNTPPQTGNGAFAKQRADAASKPTLADAMNAFAMHHPEAVVNGTKSGVTMGKIPANHCAAPVLQQQIATWSYSGPFLDFETAFDRMIHHIENVPEGNRIGFSPPADSPIRGLVTVTAQQESALDVFLDALSQLDGVVVIFREYTDKNGERRCIRETYARDATTTTFIGFNRNPQLFRK